MSEGLYCRHYQRALELIGSRWTGAVIRVLYGGVHRFAELKAEIPRISDRMLSERLRELEREGIVTRIVIPETPVQIEYHLTEKGRSLEPVMRAVIEWTMQWAPEGAVKAGPPAGAAREGPRKG